jgi:hypothetical protein
MHSRRRAMRVMMMVAVMEVRQHGTSTIRCGTYPVNRFMAFPGIIFSMAFSETFDRARFIGRTSMGAVQRAQFKGRSSKNDQHRRHCDADLVPARAPHMQEFASFRPLSWRILCPRNRLEC